LRASHAGVNGASSSVFQVLRRADEKIAEAATRFDCRSAFQSKV